MGTQGTICPHSVIKGLWVGQTSICPQAGRGADGKTPELRQIKGVWSASAECLGCSSLHYLTPAATPLCSQSAAVGAGSPRPAALGTPYSQVFLLLPLDTKPGRVKRAR